MSNTRTISSGRVTASRKQKARAAATITVIGGSLVIDGQPANAATFDVTNTNASGPGSLAQAIADANSAPGADTITFSGAGASGTITLDGTLMANKIGDDLTIVGPGRAALTLTNPTGGVLYVYNDADLTVSGLTISNVGGASGEAITVFEGGDLTVADVTIDTTTGRGIDVDHPDNEGSDTVTLTDVDVSMTGLDGIYIHEALTVSMDDVTVAGAGTTMTGGEGDGIDINDVHDVTIVNSEVTNSFDRGIEVYPIDGELVVSDTDVIDNGDAGLYWDVDSASSSATITSVDAIGNGEHGIHVYEGGDTELVDIRAVSNGEFGIYVSDVYDDLALTDIVVSNNLDGGLYISDSDPADLSIERLTDSVTIGPDTFVGNGDGTGAAPSLYIGRWGGDLSVNDVSITGEFWVDSISGDVSLTNIDVARNVAGFDVLKPQMYLDDIDGSLTMDNIHVTGAHEEGVLIDDVDEPTTISNLTVSGSGFHALYLNALDSPVTITNATVSSNDVTTPEVVLVNDSDVTFAHSTIADNTETGGTFVIAANGTTNLTLDHTIVAGNDGSLSHGGPGAVTGEYSLVETGSGLGGTTNLETADPMLGPLQDNGGDTPTQLPLTGSAAIDAGDSGISGEPATDQRGGIRVAGAAIDIGAVEIDGGALTVTDATVSEGAGTVDVIVSRSGLGDGAASATVSTADGTAEAGPDFTAVSTAVSWASGDVADKTVSVPILTDRAIEGDETFSLEISAPSGASLGTPSTGTITITDDIGAAIASLAPQRFVDTRPNGTTVDGDNEKTGKIAAGGEIEVQVAGRGGIPADATGVIMNVTAINADGNGFVTAHPCVTPRPETSSLNYTAGVNLGNEVIAGLSGDGKVCLYSSNGANLTVDVVGYTAADSPLINVTPARVLDTRSNGDTVDDVAKGAGKTTAGGEITLKVAGRAGVPTDAAAVIVNVTAINPAGTGFVTVSPCVSPAPKASSLNYSSGVNRGNELVASLNANGELCLFTSSSIDLSVDVVGYLPAGSSASSVSPSRLLETRPGEKTVDGQSQGLGKLAAGAALTLNVAGRAGVPLTAKAAVVNVTAIAPEANGFVTLHPCLPTLPLASSLNYVPGVNGGNEVIAQLDANGNLCIFTSSSAHITLDVVAYLD